MFKYLRPKDEESSCKTSLPGNILYSDVQLDVIVQKKRHLSMETLSQIFDEGWEYHWG